MNEIIWHSSQYQECLMERGEMYIFELDDQDFPALLDAFRQARVVGRYWKKGKVQFVRATNLFMMVGSSENPEKIAIKPSRSLEEAEELALALLEKEELRGNTVERDSNTLLESA